MVAESAQCCSGCHGGSLGDVGGERRLERLYGYYGFHVCSEGYSEERDQEVLSGEGCAGIVNSSSYSTMEGSR